VLYFWGGNSTFCKWEKEFEQHLENGLVITKITAKNFPNQIKQKAVKRLLKLRQEKKLGTWRI
jgi:hypothetical protein